MGGKDPSAIQRSLSMGRRLIRLYIYALPKNTGLAPALPVFFCFVAVFGFAIFKLFSRGAGSGITAWNLREWLPTLTRVFPVRRLTWLPRFAIVRPLEAPATPLPKSRVWRKGHGLRTPVPVFLVCRLTACQKLTGSRFFYAMIKWPRSVVAMPQTSQQPFIIIPGSEPQKNRVSFERSSGLS